MPNLEIVAVGTELLLGQLVDTNTSFIAQHLAGIGVDVRATYAVGDNRDRIVATLRTALERSDGAIVTGGLGPTIDDVTKDAVCAALDLGVELYAPALIAMQRFFDQIGREMRPNNRKQAELPQGSLPLDNPNGTAPGFVAFSRSEKIVACMPGVPREMRPMLEQKLIPFLRERFSLGDAIHTRIIHTIGIGESEIDHRIDELFRTSENPKIAVLAHDARADVKIMAKAESLARAEAMIAPLQREIEVRLDGFVYGTDEATPESAIHALLRARDWTVATAESCTGGRIAAALTGTPGSSKSFIGGIVSYDDAVKRSLLRVDAGLLERNGAVSEPVALAMARGARAELTSDIAISTTGIAGPTGGSPDKPVGLVWFGLDDANGTSRAYRAQFRGGRDAIQARATIYALGILWRHLTRAAVPSP